MCRVEIVGGLYGGGGLMIRLDREKINKDFINVGC